MNELSQKTIDKYLSCIRLLKNKRNLDIDDLNLDFDDILNKLEDLSSSYRKINLSAIKWYLESNNRCKKICKLITEEIRYIINISIEEDKNGLITDKQSEKYIEWSEILKLHSKLSSDLKSEFFNYEFYTMFVVLSLYCLFPVRRLEDYALLNIINTIHDYHDKNLNYYVYNESKFIFNVYKTKNNYGEQIFNVPHNLSKILDKYIKTFSITGLLLELNEKGISRNLRSVFSDHFNIKITVNDLRFSYSQFVKANYNDDQIKKISIQMANSSLMF